MNPASTQMDTAVAWAIEQIVTQQLTNVVQDFGFAGRMQPMAAVIESLATTLEAARVSADDIFLFDERDARAIHSAQLIRGARTGGTRAQNYDMGKLTHDADTRSASDSGTERDTVVRRPRIHQTAPATRPPAIRMVCHSNDAMKPSAAGTPNGTSSAASVASRTPSPPRLIGNKPASLAIGQARNQTPSGTFTPIARPIHAFSNTKPPCTTIEMLIASSAAPRPARQRANRNQCTAHRATQFAMPFRQRTSQQKRQEDHGRDHANDNGGGHELHTPARQCIAAEEPANRNQHCDDRHVDQSVSKSAKHGSFRATCRLACQNRAQHIATDDAGQTHVGK